MCRKEAEEIGLKVSRPDIETEELMMALFYLYENKLDLLSPFNPDGLLGDQESHDFSYETAYVESCSRTDTFKQEGKITRIQQIPRTPPQLQQMGFNLPPIDQVSIKFLSRNWECIRDE